MSETGNSLLATVRAAAGTGDAVSRADHDAALTAARAEGETTARAAGHAAGVTEGHAAGVTAERARISAILGHEAAAGRSRLASHLAFKTDMTVEAAAEMLGAAAPEAANPAAGFVAEKEARKELSLDPENGKDPKAEVSASWDAVAAKINAGLPNARKG